MPAVRNRFRAIVGATIAAGAMLAVPSSASALETTSYVDDNAADNNEPCTQASPCQLIQTAVNDTSAGGTVIVDGGSYNESVGLDAGKSILAQDFAGPVEGSSAINGGLAAAILVTTGETAGTIDGLTLRSANVALSLAGPAAAVTDNVFDSITNNSTGVSVNTVAAGASVIGPNNNFTDDGVDTDRRFGVEVGAGSPTITGNDFASLSDAIFIGSGSPAVSGNEITGTHVALAGGTGGSAITVLDSTPTITDNEIRAPDPDTFSLGVNMQRLGGTVGATMRRNEIRDHAIGVNVSDTNAAVSLDSDLIVGGGTGLQATDASPIGTEGNVMATNVTIAGTASEDVSLSDVALALDSSIVEDPITENPGSVNDCTIAFSRGPTTTGNDCEQFQTSAVPGFVNAGAGDYRLGTASALIDAGNPAAPANPSDFESDPRSLDGDGICPLDRRRDIGADEVAGREPTGCPSGTPVQQQASGNEVQCAALRAKVKKLSRRIRNASSESQEAKLKAKRKKVRRQLRELGCP